MKRDLDDDDDDDEDEEGAGKAAVGADKEAKAASPAAPADKKGKKPGKKAAASAASSSTLGSGGVDVALNRCTVTVTLPLHSPKLLMLEIVERVAASTMVRSTPSIDKVRC